MSLIFRRMLMMTARRMASDPRLRQQVMDGAQRARPVIERSAKSVRSAAVEVSPLKDPLGFAGALRRRLRRPD